MHGFDDDPDDLIRQINDPLWRITHGQIDKLDPLGGSLFEEIDEGDEDEGDAGDEDGEDDALDALT